MSVLELYVAYSMQPPPNSERRRVEIDVAPPHAEHLGTAKKLQEFLKLAEVLAGLIKNTKSKQALALADSLVSQPKKRRAPRSRLC